jgi:hypothetical protein
MKTTERAENEEKAKKLVKSKIKIHKIEKSKDEFSQAIDMIDNMLNFLGFKKRP